MTLIVRISEWQQPDMLMGNTATLSHWLPHPRETSAADTVVLWSRGELTYQGR